MEEELSVLESQVTGLSVYNEKNIVFRAVNTVDGS